MNTIKSFQIALIIFAVSVLAGCSDQFLSPELNTSVNSSENSEPSSTGNAHVNRFTQKIRLNIKGSYTFNYWNTQLLNINSINADVTARYFDGKSGAISEIQGNSFEERMKIECQDISVTSSSSESDIALNCKSNGLNLKDITIENTSSGIIDVYVILTGVKRSFKPSEE